MVKIKSDFIFIPQLQKLAFQKHSLLVLHHLWVTREESFEPPVVPWMTE